MNLRILFLNATNLSQHLEGFNTTTTVRVAASTATYVDAGTAVHTVASAITITTCINASTSYNPTIFITTRT